MVFAVDQNILLNYFCNAVTKNLMFLEFNQLVVFQLLLRLVKLKNIYGTFRTFYSCNCCVLSVMKDQVKGYQA